jgi:hypothetical protein
MPSPTDRLLLRRSLRHEIALVLALKVVLLGALWLVFFRSPDETPGAEQVGSALLGTAHSRHAVNPHPEGGTP